MALHMCTCVRVYVCVCVHLYLYIYCLLTAAKNVSQLPPPHRYLPIHLPIGGGRARAEEGVHACVSVCGIKSELSVRVVPVEGTYPGRLSQVVQGEQLTML